MDPKACLLRAADLFDEQDFEGCDEALRDYADWRSNGGFEPRIEGTGGDSYARYMRARLPDEVRLSHE